MANTNATDRTESPNSSTAGSTDPAHNWKGSVSDVAAEKARELGRAAIDQVENARQHTADTLHGAADSLHRAADTGRIGMERVVNAAHNTADRIGNVASYVEERDSKHMIKDIADLLRKYPTQSLIAGIVVAFFAGRALSRSANN